MTLNYTVSIENNADARAYLFTRTYQYKELVRSRKLLFGVVLALCTFLFALVNRRRLPVLLAGLLVCGAMFFILSKRLPTAVHKSLRKRLLDSLRQQFADTTYDGDVTLALLENSLQITGGEHTVEMPYKDIVEIIEEQGFLFLLPEEEAKGFPIPLSAFANDSQKEEFTQKIKAAML